MAQDRLMSMAITLAAPSPPPPLLPPMMSDDSVISAAWGTGTDGGAVSAAASSSNGDSEGGDAVSTGSTQMAIEVSDTGLIQVTDTAAALGLEVGGAGAGNSPTETTAGPTHVLTSPSSEVMAMEKRIPPPPLLTEDCDQDQDQDMKSSASIKSVKKRLSSIMRRLPATGAESKGKKPRTPPTLPSSPDEGRHRESWREESASVASASAALQMESVSKARQQKTLSPGCTVTALICVLSFTAQSLARIPILTVHSSSGLHFSVLFSYHPQKQNYRPQSSREQSLDPIPQAPPSPGESDVPPPPPALPMEDFDIPPPRIARNIPRDNESQYSKGGYVGKYQSTTATAMLHERGLGGVSDLPQDHREAPYTLGRVLSDIPSEAPSDERGDASSAVTEASGYASATGPPTDRSLLHPHRAVPSNGTDSTYGDGISYITYDDMGSVGSASLMSKEIGGSLDSSSVHSSHSRGSSASGNDVEPVLEDLNNLSHFLKERRIMREMKDKERAKRNMDQGRGESIGVSIIQEQDGNFETSQLGNDNSPQARSRSIGRTHKQSNRNKSVNRPSRPRVNW